MDAVPSEQEGRPERPRRAPVTSPHAVALLEELADMDRLAQVVAEDCVRETGAVAGFIVVGRDADQLEMLAHVREGAPMRRCSLSTDASLPAVDAWRTGEPVVLSTRAELYERYPGLGRDRTHRAAMVCLPLHGERGVAGALCLTWASEQRFTPGRMEAMEEIARACARAVSRLDQ